MSNVAQMADGMVLKLFAGSDGAGIGISRALPGVPSVGLEIDRDACATMAAAGLPAIRCDIAQYPTEPFVGRVSGLWASPPCTDFSAAGKRAGIEGETGRLIFEVPRWVHALRPEWVVCEEVPSVLPWWEKFAAGFDGYSTWTGILDTANYGTPQNRERAILLASRVRHVGPPKPTHAQHPHPVLFGDEELPWVSMAEALGWGMTDRPSFTVTAGGTATGGPEPFSSSARKVMVLNTHRDQRPDGTTQTRPAPAPAPAVTAKASGQWAWERPATTVMGDQRVFPPDGHHPYQGLGSYSGRAVKVTLEELATLQDFPPDWPFQGNKSSVSRQIGNAVPAKLAAACVQAVAPRNPVPSGSGRATESNATRKATGALRGSEER